MTRYGKGTAINLTKVTAPDQINVINDNFKKIQTQLMGLKTYLEPIAQAGKEANDRLNMYLGSDPPVSFPQMTNYAQKQIAMGPEPPEEPEVGDVWFVTDEEGNVIAIRHWDGSQWVDDVNNEAVAEAIERAQQEAEAAKQQAQEAVDLANQAAQEAQEAIQQAQQGFDAAQNALAEAALAQSIATNAIGQAQTAFDHAQSALTKALEALDATNILSQKVDQNTGDISTLFQTATSLVSRVSDAEGNISTLTQIAQGLQSSVTNLQGDVSTLTQTANSLNSRLRNVEGDVSELVQTSSDLTSRISDAEGNISVLQQTANSHGLRITDAEGNISSLIQTVNGIQSQVSDIDGNVSTLTQIANSLQSRISNAEGSINTLTQTANSLTSQISTKADQSWVSSQISQLSNAINLRVEKDKIINQINISTEGILIDGKKIHITGQTTIDNAVIKDAMIESVSASKISATSLSAISANLGTVTAGTIRGVTLEGVTGTFAGNLTASYLVIGPESPNMPSWADGRVAIEFKNPVRITTGVYDWGTPLTLTIGNNSAYFEGLGVTFERELTVDGTLFADHGWFDGQVFELSNASLLNIYIRPQSGGSVRFTAAGTTTSFVPIYASNVFTTSVDINTGGTHLYARPSSSGNLKVTATGTVDVWRPVEAASFQNRSLERYKQDIELWNGSALDIIRNSEIYQYRLKTDVQNGIDKLKYGFIIGEGYRTPNEVITPSGESVDIYVQSSVAWKAIQELDTEQQSIKEDTEWLKLEIQVLKQQNAAKDQKISELEQKILELEAKII